MFFIWAIVVGVNTILILFTTISVFCCLLYSFFFELSAVLRSSGEEGRTAESSKKEYNSIQYRKQQKTEIVVKRMRMV